ncbi:TldD/PmbA family protein [Chloroflexota bacterium]
MSDIDIVAWELSELFRKHRADYMEARLEEGVSSQLLFTGRKLESIGRSVGAGGNIRVMVNGGWGFVSFNSLTGLGARLEAAINQARLASSGQTRLAEVTPVNEKFLLEGRADPVAIPLAMKKDLLDEYNEIIWSTPSIQTSNLGYGDGRKRVIFLNSEGTFLEQERVDISFRASAVAARDGEVQQSGISVGSTGNWHDVNHLHDEIKRLAQHAVALLDAPQVKGGEYTVVLDPVLAGVFVHEAFGHLSESDFVYENERMRELMTLGKQFGGPNLNIVDNPAMPNLRGTYRYDDEGVPTAKNYLISEGKLVGRLHSRETAAIMGEKPTGNARAIDYSHPPIVRMSNTYIEPGKATFDDMIAGLKEGLYAKNWYGGTTSMEMFTFSSGETYMIRNGKIAEAVRPVMLTGNVFSTLGNIDMVGNTLGMNQGGGCGKGGQMPLPVSNGSPHIRIQHCLVGGK